jgi:hypothetical protein
MLLVHPASGVLKSGSFDLVDRLVAGGFNNTSSAKNFLTSSQAVANLFGVVKDGFTLILLDRREALLNSISDCVQNAALLSLKPALNSIATIVLKYVSQLFLILKLRANF